MKKIEVNCETGEETVIDFTPEEIAAVKAEQAQEAKKQAERDTEQAAKDAAKVELLVKLGITAEEAALLFA